LWYAREVTAGSILACKWVKLACKRHLDDLVRSKSRDFSYRYDSEKADRVCRFVEKMPHTKNRWAAQKLKLKLEPWQIFITCCLFGWVEKDTGHYRFTEAYIAVPRKNGKSPWAAAIASYKFAADGEYGAEVYCGATTEKQAWEVFKPARLMAVKTPSFVAHYGITVHKKILTKADGSKFEPVIGKPGDGAAPSCAILDEFHEQDSDDLYDTMKTGMVGRENPLLLIITTAGDNIAGPCYAVQEDGQKVLEGLIENDQLFVIIFTIDEGDDWTSELALRKANPNYGISVDVKKLKAALKDAIQSARKQNTFKRKHLNIWTNTSVGWFNMEVWAKCYDPEMRIDKFLGQPCIASFDLASKNDLASTLKMFREVSDITDPGKDHYYVFHKSYLNEAAIADARGSHFEGWSKPGGPLVSTPGNNTDLKLIINDIVADSKKFKIREVAHDPHLAMVLVQFIEGREDWDKKVLFVEVAQNVKMLDPAMKELEALGVSGRLHHDGDPLLAWAISNVVVKPDANDNLFPRRQREDKKIDPATCLIIAQNRWMAAPREAPRSVYSKRGIRTT
jgi:phage terminase large subunit-like protein